MKAKIKDIKASASVGLQSFESVVATLGRHIRYAKKIEESSFSFQFTTEQNLETIRSDRYSDSAPSRSEVCLNLSPAYDHLKKLQDNLKGIKNSNFLPPRIAVVQQPYFGGEFVFQ